MSSTPFQRMHPNNYNPINEHLLKLMYVPSMEMITRGVSQMYLLISAHRQTNELPPTPNVSVILELLDYHGRVVIICYRVHVCMYTDMVQLAHVLVRLTCTTWYIHYMYTDMDSVNHHALCTVWFPASNQIDYYLWLSKVNSI